MSISVKNGICTKARFEAIAGQAGLVSIRYQSDEEMRAIHAELNKKREKPLDFNPDDATETRVFATVDSYEGDMFKAVLLLAYELMDDALAGKVNEGSTPTVVDTEELIEAVSTIQRYLHNDYDRYVFESFPLKDS